jgi:hypothetical protein
MCEEKHFPYFSVISKINPAQKKNRKSLQIVLLSKLVKANVLTEVVELPPEHRPARVTH